MTIAAAKEKLHDIIDHADDQKVFDLLSLFDQKTVSSGYQYEEATIAMLHERSEEYSSGISETHTLEESMAIVNAQRSKSAKDVAPLH